MVNQAHFSYPFLLWLLISIIFGHLVTTQEAFMVLFAALAPDIDFLLEIYLTRKNPNKISNHHNFITHAPLFYMPFVIGIGIWNIKYGILVFYGLATHFLMDTLISPRGIKWLYPFKGKYYSLTDFTKGIEDTNKWLKAYKKLPIYKYDNIAFAITVVLVIALYIF